MSQADEEPAQKKEKEEEEDKELEQAKALNELPALERIQEHWDKYAEEKQEDKKNPLISQYMKDARLETDGNNLMIYSQSKTASEYLEQRDSRYLERFFYKVLGGKPNLVYDLDPNIESEDKQPFTAKEKLEKLIEINPKIKDMKDQLGLDLEH